MTIYPNLLSCEIWMQNWEQVGEPAMISIRKANDSGDLLAHPLTLAH